MSGRAALIDLAGRLNKARVLCVGDVMLDRFVTGRVRRISPEAPIPILHVGGETAMLGGAGNVANNLAALGVRVRFVAVTGNDPAGREVAELLGALSSVKARLVIDKARPTSIKTRFLSGNQQILRADHEDPAALSKALAAKVVQAAKTAIKDCQVVVLSDYGKGVLAPGTVAEIIAAAKKAGKPVVVDPKGDDFRVYRGASIVTPNRDELQRATRLPVDGDREIAAACRRLIKRAGVGAVLATRSQDGMTLVRGSARAVHLGAEAREVFDVSGAGDTVAAALAAALAAGAPLEQAAELANVAAGIVVGKVGTAAAPAQDVIGALHHQDISRAEAKVLSLDQALGRIGAWRRGGVRVGFTNGCFDLLHPGHVALLAQAKSACGRLVVGLNSDASAQRLKGKGRPVQSEAARAAVLASLETVDMVVLFSEDTPLKLIRAMRPDVLVKGKDYSLETVVGARDVKGWGGRVVLADLKPGHSTTATIARMGKKPK